MTSDARIVVGNLDCESHWARLTARKNGRRLPPVLRKPLLERISLYATLLRVYAEEGDSLWTPAPVNPDCLREVPGLARPQLINGAHTEIPAEQVRVAWGTIDEVSAAVNNRAFAHGLAADLGVADPESAILHQVASLEKRLSNDAPWVVKAPHCAAGRERVRGEAGPLTPQVRRNVEALLGRQGALLYEPWRQRTADFGYGLYGAPHTLEVDGAGRFKGIVTPGPELPLQERLQVEQMQQVVGEALTDAGYDGPWGIDAWRYLDDSGQEHFQPLGEINARLTFGDVANTLRRRVAAPLFGEAARVALRFGNVRQAIANDRIVPLVGSPDGTVMNAWLESLED